METAKGLYSNWDTVMWTHANGFEEGCQSEVC